MQLRAEQLEAHLAAGKLAPVYAVHGDEPLLALEAADAVRAAARRQGFSERELFEPARGFDWSALRGSLASMSLFATKKIVELRLPTGKPGTQGGETIAAWCERPSPDTLLLVSLPRLDRAGQNSAWFLALGQAGAVVEIWPVERARLPGWISERLARQKQKAPREVLEFLAGRVEGNLLAAYQEVQKLALLAPPGELSLATVQQAVSNVARYDPQDAAEALLAAETARYAHVLEGLRGEGEEPTYLLWVLSNMLFVLQSALRGGSIDSAFSQHRVYNKVMQRALRAAAARFSEPAVERAISRAAAIDRDIKGVGRFASGGEPWQGFLALGLELHRGAGAY